ncbi:Flp pilus assembly protein TadG [Nocardiopsis mwathae]|uniref:Flp pilus assembly protein TadG n=1 Tax=Nocardiopsis mwathae TaxID=1472723 RepID=A0A7W9YN63_9ACTN|nr:TadE family type IV pilus minor pilin [Nocardiopsis mwathae]MBB6174161.1 Flp pilus assembly protein TadG [Nocardiopsis mwathae]
MPCSRAGDRGTVTAETAVALPSLLLVLGAGITAVQAATVQLECVDAARLGARALAKGESESTVLALVTGAAPEAADVALSADGGFARVVVTAPIRLGPVTDLPVLAVGEAATPVEPGPRPPR